MSAKIDVPKLRIRGMRASSYLLPDPGGEVVRECLDEIERLNADLAAKDKEIAELRADLVKAESADGCFGIILKHR